MRKAPIDYTEGDKAEWFVWQLAIQVEYEIDRNACYESEKRNLQHLRGLNRYNKQQTIAMCVWFGAQF